MANGLATYLQFIIISFLVFLTQVSYEYLDSLNLSCNLSDFMFFPMTLYVI